jgi:hypothetical protein
MTGGPGWRPRRALPWRKAIVLPLYADQGKRSLTRVQGENQRPLHLDRRHTHVSVVPGWRWACGPYVKIAAIW